MVDTYSICIMRDSTVYKLTELKGVESATMHIEIVELLQTIHC
jgi:hypothetical protein